MALHGGQKTEGGRGKKAKGFWSPQTEDTQWREEEATIGFGAVGWSEKERTEVKKGRKVKEGENERKNVWFVSLCGK